MDVAKLVESAKKYPDEVLGRDRGSGRRAGGSLAAALAARAINTHELDLGELFIECFGWNNFQHCRRNLGDCAERAHTVMHKARLEEAAGANATAAFLNITQQFAYERVLTAYDVPARVFVGAIPSRPSKFKFERIPGVTHVGDEQDVVEEGKPYPEVGVGEDWTDTPETKKRGMVARATKEAVFFDRTGEFMQKLDTLGDWQGVSDEKRAITCVVDAGETAKMQYRYRWRNLGPIATYGDNSGNHSWDNLAASNALSTYANVQAAWQLLVQMTDPATGEPQNVTLKHLCVPPALAFTVPFALKGMVKRTAPGYATSGTPTSSEIPNPTGDVIGQIQTLSTQLFRSITGDDTTWFCGDLGAAFEQIENWPLTVTTLGAQSQLEFDADVIFQSKVSKRSTFSTVQPRKVVKNTA